MVNYDTQDGFSVSSIRSSHQHYGSGSGSSSRSSSSHGQNNGSNSMNGPPMPPQTTFLKVPSTSVLTIQEVHLRHGGNYTCAPSNARPASITVHVLRGKISLYNNNNTFFFKYINCSRN